MGGAHTHALQLTLSEARREAQEAVTHKYVGAHVPNIVTYVHTYVRTYIHTHVQYVIPYIAKFSRPKNFANRFQKGGAEIFATKIFAKAALIHCVIL